MQVCIVNDAYPLFNTLSTEELYIHLIQVDTNTSKSSAEKVIGRHTKQEKPSFPQGESESVSFRWCLTHQLERTPYWDT